MQNSPDFSSGPTVAQPGPDVERNPRKPRAKGLQRLRLPVLDQPVRRLGRPENERFASQILLDHHLQHCVRALLECSGIAEGDSIALQSGDRDRLGALCRILIFFSCPFVIRVRLVAVSADRSRPAWLDVVRNANELREGVHDCVDFRLGVRLASLRLLLLLIHRRRCPQQIEQGACFIGLRLRRLRDAERNEDHAVSGTKMVDVPL
jgi:hypothetical protein